MVAVFALRWFWQNTSAPSTYYQVRTVNLSVVRSLYTADSVGGNPAASNVRSGTVFGPNSELTGTCAVPSASSVLSGVAVDATTGTATISAESIRAAIGLTSANLNSQLAAIPTTAAPTAAQVRAEMDANSTKLANLDATVSSRPTAANIATAVWAAAARTLTTTIPSASDIATAVWAAGTRTLTTAIDNSATIAAAVWAYATGRTITGGTVDTLTNAPSVPSAATIASQVRTELATELARIDVPTSSRLAPAGTLARVTLTDTATTLTNAPTVPTASQIASQVRTELSTELARIDAAISSRLAAVSYSAAPTTAAIRTELSIELARIDAAISTRLSTSGYTTPPSASTNAAAIRTELSTELARIDAAVSSRLAPGGTLARVTLVDTATTLTNAPTVPTAAQIATATRSELAPELARVSNCSTVESTGDQIAALNS